MRKVLVLAVMLGLIGSAAAEDAKLKIGDKAPPVKATKWWQGKEQGKEITSFAEGRVYVMEFWAIWCGPCIAMMPHMSELQTQYKDKATFIGFTSKDNRGNNLERVQAFVEKRGPKLGYLFAYADDGETNKAYMEASGQSGIPCCFVIDKAGKIAYIGHPMYLDVILPKVVEGKWTEADLETIKGIEKEVNAVFEGFRGDAEAALKTLAGFEKKYPALAHIPYFTAPKIDLLLKAKKYDEAAKVAEEAVAKAVKAEDPGPVGNLSRMLLSPKAQTPKEMAPVALKAAEAVHKMAGEKDPVALFFVAQGHFANGDRAKAKDFGAKALAAATNDDLKKEIEGLIKRYDEEKK
jgi:thiol-disulfide isomerase/thioredoxin